MQNHGYGLEHLQQQLGSIEGQINVTTRSGRKADAPDDSEEKESSPSSEEMERENPLPDDTPHEENPQFKFWTDMSPEEKEKRAQEKREAKAKQSQQQQATSSNRHGSHDGNMDAHVPMRHVMDEDWGLHYMQCEAFR